LSDDEILKEAREAFELAADAEAENRREALDDLRFARLGEQWPERVRRERELDGRPCLTINRLPAFIRQVVNDARQNKPAMVVHPVDDDADPKTAEVMAGLIRHIEQTSDAEVAYDTALDFAVTGGFGYFRINTRYAADDTFHQDLVIERVANPFSIYGDPNGTAADSSDWNTAFGRHPAEGGLRGSLEGGGGGRLERRQLRPADRAVARGRPGDGRRILAARAGAEDDRGPVRRAGGRALDL